MRTTIDSGGRIVVPKKVREFLGLVAGSEVDIELDGSGGGFRVKAVASPVDLVRIDGVLVVNGPKTSVPPPSADELRDILEATRDHRL